MKHYYKLPAVLIGVAAITSLSSAYASVLARNSYNQSSPIQEQGALPDVTLSDLLSQARSRSEASKTNESRLIEKLRSVPVFTITNAQGAPLVAPVKNPQNNVTSVAGVFISQRDAQSFIDQLKKKNPNLAKTVRVIPVSLADVYKLEQTNKNKPQRLGFSLVPVQKQVESARALLRQSGQQVQQFRGVPLFVARAGKEEGYLMIQQGNQQVIPLFFDKEQSQSMIDSFKKQKPDLASTVKIQVLTLEVVIQSLQTKNDQSLNQILLVPSRESIEFLRSRPASRR